MQITEATFKVDKTKIDVSSVILPEKFTMSTGDSIYLVL